MMRKRIFTSGEAARICGLSVSTLKRWIQREALRSFRTPGGDIRILKSDLLDFMRRYGIPLPMDLAPEPAVLLAVDSPEIRRCLRAALASTAIATREAQDDFALGCSLSKGDVTHLIIQSRPQTDDLERCAAIRDAVAPRHIRIGMVCEAALPAPPLDKRQAEVIVSRQQRDWERHLLRCLLQQEDLWDTAGESAKRGRHVALVGEGRA